MFGIPDAGIWSVYLLIVLCVAGAVVYGIVKWNKED